MSAEEKKEEEVLKQGQEFEQVNDNLKKDGEGEVSSLGKKDIVKYVAIGLAVICVAVGGFVIYRQLGGNASTEVAEDDESLIDEGELYQELMEADPDDETKEQLRAVGYTGYDIEQFIANGDDLNKKIKQAKKARQKEFNKEWAQFLDTTSDAFKDLMNKTWLGGPVLDKPVGDSEGSPSTLTYNLDYEKLDPHGYQFFIRIKYKNGYIFMPVTAKRYQELSQKGNIVVEISEETYGGVTSVTNIVEQNIRSDEEDSGEDEDEYEFDDGNTGDEYEGFFN